MKDHRMPFLGIGAASIVLVLTIVSLSVLATLTISSANGDYTLSQKKSGENNKLLQGIE